MGVEVRVKKLSETAVIPDNGSEFSAGYDLYADISVVTEIPPHSTIMIPTGLAFELPIGSWGGIFARSGIASKHGLRPANCVGVIDSDYRGEVMVALHNDTDVVKSIEPRQKIAQFILLPYFQISFEEVDELNSTERGEGGFGSTGK